jgi:hypothetical protein
MAESWTRQEVEAAVADYLDMLEAELSGTPSNKSEHRRRLSARLRNRSDAAVERKHQNISAVLIRFDFQYVSGYKPLWNYQGLLEEVVKAHLHARPALMRLAESDADRFVTPPPVGNILDRMVAAPSRREAARGRQVREPRGSPPRPLFHHMEREGRNAELGRAGEEFVLSFERARLSSAGRRPLAERVEHVSRTRGDGLGFDVLSFEPSGRERLIEVKTTKYGPYTPFHVTSNEVEVSRERADEYQVYRVFDFRKSPRLFALAGPIPHACHLTPTCYRAEVG